MDQVRISCHADHQALQDRSDERMLLKLVSLESLSVASDSYALLRNLIERRDWRCPQIDLLSLVAGVAVELHKIKHDLFPLVLVQEEAKLGEGGFPEAILLLKNSGIALLGLREDAKEIGSLVEEDEFSSKVRLVGGLLKYSVDEVLNGNRKFAWLQSRMPPVLDKVDVLLSNPVCFPDDSE